MNEKAHPVCECHPPYMQVACLKYNGQKELGCHLLLLLLYYLTALVPFAHHELFLLCDVPLPCHPGLDLANHELKYLQTVS